jgi:2,4-diketo-3-deoxy-L-fuconate hydrolase
MRLVSYGDIGAEHPGILLDDQTILPLRQILSRAGIHLSDANDLIALWPTIATLIDAAKGANVARIPLEGVRLGSPVRPGKIVGVGFNYARHGDAISLSEPPPGPPVLFLKPPDCVCGPNDPIVSPPETDELDYEVELGVVISRAGHRIQAADAFEHVAGFVVCNDLTARDVALGAMEHHPLLVQLARGKGFPTFCPVGPWMLTADEIQADQDLRLQLSVNEEPRQDAHTSEMRIDVPGLIESISASMKLLPGDLLLTGTPFGCGADNDPPGPYLAPGDRVHASITGLGELDQIVEAEDSAATTTPSGANSRAQVAAGGIGEGA